ncbi:sperm-tail PG-rich repeat-containing protein 2-like [Apis cerana]|uniref:sperm-tail PG-rich repeat-containing protein 2-like n=1 Tax=Apis cerana TaxID=7461 RepID=UPI002B22CFCB|nr:sperm-tail PG-rich repeat-containing protein 2-like [Apis cerana]
MTGRTEHQPFITPGPGHYEHETKKTANQIHDEKIREIKRMTSWQPRSLDILYRVKMRENLPAPNAYKIKSVFDKYSKSRCKCDTYVVEPPPFGQTAKRFVDADSDIPGPGTYNPIIPIKCTSSIFPAPFGSYATRFKKDPTHFGPGPSDYDLNAGNLAFESERRYKYTYAKKMKPQVYLDAISYCEEEEEYYTPCSPKRIEETKTLVHHVAFKSKVERFPEVQKKSNLPDPTSYHLSKDILKNAKGGVIDRSTKIEKYTPLLGPAYYTRHPDTPLPYCVLTEEPGIVAFRKEAFSPIATDKQA